MSVILHPDDSHLGRLSFELIVDLPALIVRLDAEAPDA
jgi:hypothetical protein